jgi:L-fuculose-phosphate aldolase
LKFEALRAEVVETLQRMAAGGLVLGAAGNVSARAGDAFAVVSPTSLPYETLQPEDVSVVATDGSVVEGAAASAEVLAHLAILAARGEVGAVVHTHSAYASALGCVVDEIPVIAVEQAASVGGAIPVCPYVPSGTAEMGEAVAAAAGGRWAVVIRNHGPFCFGRDLADAVGCAFAVEECARMYALARELGEPSLLADDETHRVAERYGRR